MMKYLILKTWKIYKALIFLLSIIYWIGVIIDDWGFIEKYWSTNWLDYIKIWTLWYLVYAIFFSLIYWIIGGIISSVIFVRTKKKSKLFNMTKEEVYSKANSVEVLSVMTTNERLWTAELMEHFDYAKIHDREIARTILKAIKVDEISINRILK